MLNVDMEGLDLPDNLKTHEIGDTTSTVQQPGEIIRPNVSEGSVEEIVKKRYGLTVIEMKELDSYDDRNFYIQVEPHHSSPTIQHLHPHGYVVKIYNSKDSLNPAGFDAQHDVMDWLIRNGIPTQKTVTNLDGTLYSLEAVYPDKEQECVPRKHMVELRTFVPGRIILEVPYTPSLLVQMGGFIAKMTNIFQDFNNTYLKNDPSSRLWSLTNVPLMTKYTLGLTKEERSLIQDTLSTFITRVVPQYGVLPKGYIHGDINDQNILVSRNASGDDYDICGILDFTEVEYSYPVIDLAINLAYMMIESDVLDQLDTPGYILTGYQSVRDLTPEEWDVLVPCVAARLAQSLTFGVHAQCINPENAYVLTTANKGWPLLKRIRSESESSLLSRWKMIINSF